MIVLSTEKRAADRHLAMPEETRFAGFLDRLSHSYFFRGLAEYYYR
jgi:hypothetical protein